MLGNTAMLASHAYEEAVSPVTLEAFNRAVGRPDTAYFDQATSAVIGMTEGVGQGITKTWEQLAGTFRDVKFTKSFFKDLEVNFTRGEFDNSGKFDFQARQRAISGTTLNQYMRKWDVSPESSIMQWSGMLMDMVGLGIRLPFHGMSVADTFFKTANYRIAHNVEAFRIARTEAMEGSIQVSEIAFRAKQLIRENPSDLHELAMEAGRYRTFTQHNGIAHTVASWQNPAARLVTMYIMPFVKTPMNILKTLNDMSFGSLGTLVKGNADQRAIAASRLALTGAGLGFAYKFAYEGNLIGGHPKHLKETLKEMNIPEYSFRVGDTWYPIQGVDPFSMFVGMAADLATYNYEMEHIRQFDPDAYLEIGERSDQLIAMLIYSFSRNVLDKTMVTGVKNFIEATQSERGADKFVGSMAAMSVPYSSLLRQIQTSDDEWMREVKTMSDQLYNLVDHAKLRVALNQLGEPMPNHFNPITRSREYTGQSDLVLTEFLKLGLSYTPIEDRVTVAGETFKISPEERYELRQIPSQMRERFNLPTMRETLTSMFESSNYQTLPAYGKRKAIDRVVSKYRQVGRAVWKMNQTGEKSIPNRLKRRFETYLRDPETENNDYYFNLLMQRR